MRVCIEIDRETIEELDKITRATGIPRSELIRQAVRLFLKTRTPPEKQYKFVRLTS